MHINLAVLVVTLFIAFGERINKMDFDLTRAEWLLLILMWGLAAHANRKWFSEQWGEFKRKESRRKLINLNWFDELRENLEKKN